MDEQRPGSAERVGSAAGASPRLRSIAFDGEAVALIAEALGVGIDLAPFQLPGAAVYQLLIPGAGDRPSALVTLWPSLRRVDAIGGSATVVFTGVASVDLIAGIEVIFRQESGAVLIVARGGKIIVRT